MTTRSARDDGDDDAPSCEVAKTATSIVRTTPLASRGVRLRPPSSVAQRTARVPSSPPPPLPRTMSLRCAPRATIVVPSAMSQQRSSGKTTAQALLKRRDALFGAAIAPMVLSHVFAPRQAAAFDRPPQGFTRYFDAIDGYAFARPSDWIEVKGSGNDVFFRDPGEVETNAFVSVSSPSSSTYASVRDLGTPEAAAKRILSQYLEEYMSTRLGVRRESEILSATERVNESDGSIFYDIKLRISSYSAKNQYGLTEADRPQYLEWDRTLVSALGTENGKLYELRLQSPTSSFERHERDFGVMMDSFKQFEVDTPSVRSGFGL
jgi:hypothetical protein